ncbi:MAG: biotin/lipoyl-binding protein, partial [Oscillospiraceae bacterium]|nr:biotin/lipoyl-binding protein [Oscillospiraceae bacterium]
MYENKTSTSLIEEPEKTAGSVSQEELLALLGKGRKKKLPKYFFVVAAAVIAVGGFGIYNYINSRPDETAEKVFRKYTVTRGDVTVGTTESSSISLDREVIKFPVSTTVEKIFVKEGQSVKEGEPLMQLNADEIAAGLVTYQLQVKMAQLELEQAKLDQQTKLLKAEQEYKSAVLEGQLAESNQNITVTQLEKKLKDAQEDLEDTLEDLHEYHDYERNYDDDYDKVAYWSAKMESYRELYTDYKDQYDK